LQIFTKFLYFEGFWLQNFVRILRVSELSESMFMGTWLNGKFGPAHLTKREYPRWIRNRAKYAQKMITVVIETFARCQLYRLLWP